ncbi:probable E3 ubiquitin-protein ligase HERC1 [Hyalella azteca]|uniref:Probable E3 ubiquitin-protein ligase HERC1 n=1 Tax=Hyalella azteca TaxID=294128 RepID=A0A979FXJ4_HYAAZ|nr:probable E3 ubiquitin-protein ligase HERC1 [Hyalella azteca]
MSAVTSRCSLIVNFIVENIFPSSESDLLKPGNREVSATAAADPDQEYVVPGSASLMAIVNALALQHSKAMSRLEAMQLMLALLTSDGKSSQSFILTDDDSRSATNYFKEPSHPNNASFNETSSHSDIEIKRTGENSSVSFSSSSQNTNTTAALFENNTTTEVTSLSAETLFLIPPGSKSSETRNLLKTENDSNSDEADPREHVTDEGRSTAQTRASELFCGGLLPSVRGDGGTGWWSWAVSHYLEGVECSSVVTQRAIRRCVHDIYQHLVRSLLLQQHQKELGERLSLLTVFALSVRFEWPDLSLVVSSGLLEVLARLAAPGSGLLETMARLAAPGDHLPSVADLLDASSAACEASYAAGGGDAFELCGASRTASSHQPPPSPLHLLPFASHVLFQIITILVGHHAENLDSDVRSRVVSLLYKQVERQTDCIIALNEAIHRRLLNQETGMQTTIGMPNTSDSDGDAGNSDSEEGLSPHGDMPPHPDSDGSEEVPNVTDKSDENQGNGSSRRRLMLKLPRLKLDADSEVTIDDEVEQIMQVKLLEVTLGNLLVFIRRLFPNKKLCDEIGQEKWVHLLLKITGASADTHLPNISSLRTRLLAFTLLSVILPSAKLDPVFKDQIVRKLFTQLGLYMWVIAPAQAHLQATKLMEKLNKHKKILSSPNLIYDDTRPDSPEDNLLVQEVGFDPEKLLCCSVEGGHTLVHGPGGRGYGLGSTPITSGCFQWKFLIVKESRGYEGTCIGVSKFPVRDYSHRTTSDMWLYRAYSGNLYHNGELSRTLPGFTQGDYITVVLDMEARTLSFGKNGDEPEVAFENIDAPELYPCVLFYSTNPGEKVKMVDMQMRGSPKDLDVGEPYCAPQAAVMCEAHVTLLRELHNNSNWTKHVNESIIERLRATEKIFPANVAQTDPFITQDAIKDETDESNSVENLIKENQSPQDVPRISTPSRQTSLSDRASSEKSDEESDSSGPDHRYGPQDEDSCSSVQSNESERSNSSCAQNAGRFASTQNFGDCGSGSESRTAQTEPRRRRKSRSKSSSSNISKKCRAGSEDWSCLDQLCRDVWPALAVIGGVDGGLRVGGQCVVGGPSGRRAMVLGMLKPGQTSIKVQWCDKCDDI